MKSTLFFKVILKLFIFDAAGPGQTDADSKDQDDTLGIIFEGPVP